MRIFGLEIQKAKKKDPRNNHTFTEEERLKGSETARVTNTLKAKRTEIEELKLEQEKVLQEKKLEDLKKDLLQMQDPDDEDVMNRVA